MTDTTMKPQGDTLHLDQASFQSTLDGAGEQPVLVDFYADWCGPCKIAAPIVDKLATEFKGSVKVAKVDVDASRDLAVQYQVMSIPTVVIFKQGKEVDRVIGFPGEAGYRAMIAKAGVSGSAAAASAQAA